MICGSVSSVACVFVIVTYLSFPQLWHLRYVELGTYVAANNLIASIGVAIGPQANWTFGCYFQSFVGNANYLAAMFWTVVITYQTWMVVITGEVLKNMVPFHIVIYVLSITVTLLPLTQVAYGYNDDDADTTPGNKFCYLRSLQDGSTTKWDMFYWETASFFGWVILSVCVIFALTVHAWYKLSNMIVGPEIIRAIRRLQWYPVILVVCWLPYAVFSFHRLLFSDTFPGHQTAEVVVTAAAYSVGFFMSILFFAVNEIVRVKLRWAMFNFFNYYCCLGDLRFSGQSKTSHTTESMVSRRNTTIQQQRDQEASLFATMADYISPPLSASINSSNSDVTVGPSLAGRGDRISAIGIHRDSSPATDHRVTGSSISVFDRRTGGTGGFGYYDYGMSEAL